MGRAQISDATLQRHLLQEVMRLSTRVAELLHREDRRSDTTTATTTTVDFGGACKLLGISTRTGHRWRDPRYADTSFPRPLVEEGRTLRWRVADVVDWAQSRGVKPKAVKPKAVKPKAVKPVAPAPVERGLRPSEARRRDKARVIRPRGIRSA
jgi:predicted DNA-binding transcriptional regulator AlpA